MVNGGLPGISMGSSVPNMVKSILPFCASAKTSIHNHVFLEGVKAALLADKNWNSGDYKSPPIAGLKAFGRVYAGWAFSQDFFREELFKKMGFKTIEELLLSWENDHVKNWDANNLLAKLKTWQTADISAGPIYNNDFQKALKSIAARAILMPCNQDLYFRTKDNEIEAKYIRNVSLRPIDSPFGHCAANPGNDKNFELQLDKNISELLSK